MAALSGSGLSLGPSSAAEGWVRGSLRVLEIASPAGSLDLNAEGQVVAARCESYRVSYPGSWKSRGRLFPDELALESESVRARLETSEVDVNVDLEPGTFALPIPADAARLRPAEVGAESVFVVGRERP